MEAITLNNGVEMPALGLGVFQTPPDETRDAVRAVAPPPAVAPTSDTAATPSPPPETPRRLGDAAQSVGVIGTSSEARLIPAICAAGLSPLSPSVPSLADPAGSRCRRVGNPKVRPGGSRTLAS
jgi:hypothetical protein